MKIPKLTSVAAFAFAILTTPVVLAQTPGEFEIRYNVDALTAAQQAELQPALDAAKAFWESIIVGYQPDIFLTGIDIEVSVPAIDGPGGILAQAGVQGIYYVKSGFRFYTVAAADGTRSSSGIINVDVDDFSAPQIVDTLKHETAHAIGFHPAVFANNGLIGGSGEYIGVHGLWEYQNEYDPTANFVPLDSINAHLLESNPLEDQYGRLASNELMTSNIGSITNAVNHSRSFVSDTTIGMFRDFGYDAVTPDLSSTSYAIQIDFGSGTGYVGNNAPAGIADTVWSRVVRSSTPFNGLLYGDGVPALGVSVAMGSGPENLGLQNAALPGGPIDFAATVRQNSEAAPPAGTIYDTDLANDWIFTRRNADLGVTVTGLYPGTYDVYAFTRESSQLTRTYDVGIGVRTAAELAAGLNLTDLTVTSIGDASATSPAAFVQGENFALTQVTIANFTDSIAIVSDNTNHQFGSLSGLQIVPATTTPMCILGDVNMDDFVDFGDIPPFIAVLINGGFLCEADVDQNDIVDFSDIPAFIEILMAS